MKSVGMLMVKIPFGSCEKKLAVEMRIKLINRMLIVGNNAVPMFDIVVSSSKVVILLSSKHHKHRILIGCLVPRLCISGRDRSQRAASRRPRAALWTADNRESG